MPIVGARRIRDAQVIFLLSKRMPVEVLCVSAQTNTPSIQHSITEYFGPNVSVSCHGLDTPNPLIRVLDLVRPHFAQGYSKSIEATLRSKAQPGDIIWLSRLRMAKYIGLAKKLGCFTILDEHQIESDLLFDNAFAQPQYWHQGLTAAQCALYEKRLSYAADLVVTASPIDSFRMQKLAPHSKVQLLPHAIDTKEYVPSPVSKAWVKPKEIRLSFIGDLDYHPNVQALAWMRAELLPRLVAALRGLKLVIQVHSQTKKIDAFAKDFPEFEYYSYSDTEKLRDQIREASAVIFPLRYGRGNRIHILEAMATGVPVITTGRGADGLVLKPLEDVCITEDADAFTSHVVRVSLDSAFRRSVISKGLQTVRTQYDWSNSENAMEELLTKLGIGS